jgi:hypothetical protein
MEAKLVRCALCGWGVGDQEKDGALVSASSIGFFRICSLSSSYTNTLVWSHYASGHRGVAVEVDIPDEDVTKVTYHNIKDEGGSKNVPCETIDEFRDADRLNLSEKLDVWAYEDEYRIIQDQEKAWYRLANGVTQIIIGQAMNLETMRALKDVCKVQGIPMRYARLDPNGEVKIYDHSNKDI